MHKKSRLIIKYGKNKSSKVRRVSVI